MNKKSAKNQIPCQTNSSSQRRHQSRRQFGGTLLKTTALSGAVLAGWSGALKTSSGIGPTLDCESIGSESMNSELIDAHVHVWTPDLKRYPLAKGYNRASMQPPSFTPAQLMSQAKPAGVSRVVLIQMSYYGFDNSYMLDVIEKQKNVYRGVAVIDEDDHPEKKMKQLKQKGVRGFRIQPKNRKPDQWLRGAGMQSMWKTGADHKLALCHLINPEHLPSVEKMCQKFPNTPVVIDHFARIGIDGKIRQSDLENLCRLAKFDTVTIKVSAYYALGKKKAPYKDLGPMIQRLVKEFGASRLMWASDCPFQVVGGHHYAASINLIKSGLDFLTAKDREWILKKSAEQVFFD